MCVKNSGSLFVSGPTLRIITTILGIAAAYFLTIQSLKVELAEKAEGPAVELIDKKLTNLEAVIREGVVSKEQFYTFSRDVEARLNRIEILLQNDKGKGGDEDR
jgi:hypothetical protein